MWLITLVFKGIILLVFLWFVYIVSAAVVATINKDWLKYYPPYKTTTFFYDQKRLLTT